MTIRLEMTGSTLGLMQTLQGLIFDREHGPASLGEIATQLALSERTLRRRLRTLGTSVQPDIAGRALFHGSRVVAQQQPHNGSDRVALG